MPDRTYLEFVDPDNNAAKYWEAIVDGCSFTVNYGRIGTTGQTQTKTLPTPEKAAKAYEAKVREKLAKGYARTDGATLVGAPAPAFDRDIEVPAPTITVPAIRPMLAEEVDVSNLVDYSNDGAWVLQQKIDGHRVMLHIEGGAAVAIGRNGQASQHNPRFAADAYADVRRLPDGVALDGELVGETLWVFDLPRHDGEGIDVATPYEKRLAALEALWAEWAPNPDAYRLLPTARDAEAKHELSIRCLKEGAEGVMAKRLDAAYKPGGRSSQVVKCKFVKSADFVITGVGLDGHENYELSLYRDGALEVIGRCSAIGKERVDVGAVAEVKYLYIGADGRLYQPRFMRSRTDKGAEECVWSQVEGHGVNKEVLA